MIELQLGVWEGIDYKCEVSRRDFFFKHNNKIVGNGARFLVRKKCCNYETRKVVCMEMWQLEFGEQRK